MVAWQERLWPAGVVALAIHGIVIAALAFEPFFLQGTTKQNVYSLEVVFQEDGTGENSAKGATEDLQVNPDGGKRIDRKEAPRKPSLSRKKTPLQGAFKPEGLKSSAAPAQAFGNADPLFHPSPTYPLEARRKKIEGIVRVQLFLTDVGTVGKAVLLPPHADPILEDAALTAVRSWRFQPGVRILEIPIEFKLSC